MEKRIEYKGYIISSAPRLSLNNKTPRQAAKTKDGRERLEALLLQL